ncbi:multicopper oxidase family protein [Streptomyces kebangsaanensis]|uniref:multicopper oxidase family protein n=1 Tax=Streptomyces kebangsaanensis TaxID=864058 RepID=UPI000938D54A|nr:multicopper oxidase family protein [Streptomyces kebangsaanensis]
MHSYTRRTLLSASITAAASGLLTACSGARSRPESGPHSRSARSSGAGPGSGSGRGPGTVDGVRPFVPKGPRGYVNPSDPEVLAAERERGSGRVRKFRFTAKETSVDLGGKTVRTWTYGDSAPGRAVRVTAGDILDLTLANHLPVGTTLHSHGVRLRCDMDGVPGLTQETVKPGANFNYRFAVAHPGTYLLHSHEGMQPDRGLYAPLIVDDPREPLSYDREWVVVLDDWVDGVAGSTPEAVLAQLQKVKGPVPRGMDMGGGSGHHGHSAPHGTGGGPDRILRGALSSLLQGMSGNVDYPYYLVNGCVPHDPSVFRARPGDRIRLRIINAGADTAFRVALGGHEMTVTHTDGYPVEHRTTDALLLGMAERYDVIVTAQDGVFPLVALAEGKNARALAVLNTGRSKDLPAPSVRLDELDGRLVLAHQLVPDDSVAFADREPDREIQIKLRGNMKWYDWSFDGKPYSVEQRHPVRQGERVRLVFLNHTGMWHPLHLHGHTFALTGPKDAGARKDTAIVLPQQKLVVDFYADNPGLWMLHCHNQYHSESGMMTILGYRK